MGNMNKARVAEAARGLNQGETTYPAPLKGRGILIVDLLVRVEILVPNLKNVLGPVCKSTEGPKYRYGEMNGTEERTCLLSTNNPACRQAGDNQ